MNLKFANFDHRICGDVRGMCGVSEGCGVVGVPSESGEWCGYVVWGMWSDGSVGNRVWMGVSVVCGVGNSH